MWQRAAGAIAVAEGMHFKDKGGGCLAFVCFEESGMKNVLALSLYPRGSFGIQGIIAHLEYLCVKDNHDKAGDVEGAKGGVDDEVRVVKCTN